MSNSTGKYRHIGTGILLVTLVAACVSTKTVPVNLQAKSQFVGKTIVLARRSLPEFAVMTAGKMATGGLFGAIGGAVAGASTVTAGRELRDRFQFTDPAAKIGPTLFDELIAAHSMTSITSNKQVTSLDPKEIAVAYSGSDFVLDVVTVNWTMLYFPTHWGHYGIQYSAKAFLIDTNSGMSVGEAYCVRSPKYSKESASYDEMLADDGARITTESEIAATSCLEEIRKKLGLTS
ncbi:MAG: hypothetical protein R3E77_13950 [Steroidobacteraceae bacterium]